MIDWSLFLIDVAEAECVLGLGLGKLRVEEVVLSNLLYHSFDLSEVAC